MNKIKVGISACLLGQAVRFDGTHKSSEFCRQDLSDWFEFIPICPEVEIGLSVPREPIQLVKENNQIRVKNVSDHSRDYTDSLKALVDKKLHELDDFCGFIMMQKSPSCGIFAVKVYNQNGDAESHSAMGAFAYQLKQNYPLLPMEEAGRINDICLRENFVIRVIAYHDWCQYVLAEPKTENLLAFHSRYQLVLQAYSIRQFQQLNRLLDEVVVKSIETVIPKYFNLFFKCLSQVVTINNHAKIFKHVVELLNTQLSVKDERSN